MTDADRRDRDRRARRTALEDQATAAYRHAAAILHGAAEGHVSHTLPAPVILALICRLNIALIETASDPDASATCPHLAGRTPTVALWPGWQPGQLLCMECYRDAVRLADPDDRRCGICGRTDLGETMSVLFLLPPTILESRSGPVATSPIIVLSDVCGECHKGEAASPREDGS